MNKWSGLLIAGLMVFPLVAKADGSSIGDGDCREMEIKAKVNKKNETIKGLACRDEKGKWHLQDSKAVAATPPPPAPRSREVTAIDEPVVVTRTVVSEPVSRYVVEERPVRTYYYPDYYYRGVVVDVGWPYYYGRRYYRRW